MKAIITGATGGLGRNLTEFLLAHNWKVLALGRNQNIGNQLKTAFKSFDLSDKNACLKNWQEIDIVFHCAALSSPWGKLADFQAANIIATQNVLTAAKQFGCHKFIHISTPSIYFDFADHLQIKENYLPKQFVNFYAQTKYQAEKLVAQSSLNSIIIRPRGIFGEYDTALLPRLARLANEKGFLPLIKRLGRNAGDAIVDTTYVGNVVLALFNAATIDIPEIAFRQPESLFCQNKTPVFNITNNEPKTMAEILSIIKEILHWQVKFKTVSYSVLDMAAKAMEKISLITQKEPLLTRYSAAVSAFDQTLNIHSAQKYLNYTPQFSLSDGLERYAKHTARN
ncbi:MAG: NAD(P)-dependent oxidoreductase [Neisseriaceae bacterium]|nr:NAD(P)-dependent oxidoreductase [Neisseriaceae bacterium]